MSEEENEKNKDYTVEEFVMIAQHIEESNSAFILANAFEPDGQAKVLMTTKGNIVDIVTLIVESMIKEPKVAQIIESSMLSFNATMEARKQGN